MVFVVAWSAGVQGMGYWSIEHGHDVLMYKTWGIGGHDTESWHIRHGVLMYRAWPVGV